MKIDKEKRIIILDEEYEVFLQFISLVLHTVFAALMLLSCYVCRIQNDKCNCQSQHVQNRSLLNDVVLSDSLHVGCIIAMRCYA